MVAFFVMVQCFNGSSWFVIVMVCQMVRDDMVCQVRQLSMSWFPGSSIGSSTVMVHCMVHGSMVHCGSSWFVTLSWFVNCHGSSASNFHQRDESPEEGHVTLYSARVKFLKNFPLSI